MAFIFNNTAAYAFGNVIALYVIFKWWLRGGRSVNRRDIAVWTLVVLVYLFSSIIVLGGGDYRYFDVVSLGYGVFSMATHFYLGKRLAHSDKRDVVLYLYVILCMVIYLLDIDVPKILNDTEYSGFRMNFLEREPSLAGLKLGFVASFLLTSFQFRNNRAALKYVFIIASIFLLVTTLSKGAMLAFAVFVIVYSAFVQVWVAFVFLSCVLLAVSIDHISVQYIEYSLFGSGSGGSLASRGTLADAAVQLIKQAPWGSGFYFHTNLQDILGNARYEHNSELSSLYQRGSNFFAVSPKNVWLNFGVIFGVIPLIAIVIALFKGGTSSSLAPLTAFMIVAGFTVDLSVEIALLLGFYTAITQKHGRVERFK